MARPSKAKKPSAPSGSKALILSGTPEAPLSPGQKRFNRLLTEIDRLRRRIQSTRAELEDLSTFALKEVQPLELERARAAGDLARALYKALKEMYAASKRRRRMSQAHKDYLLELVEEGLRMDLPNPHPDLAKIHEELTGSSVEASRQSDFDLLRGQMEALLRTNGFDVDLSDFDVNLPPDQAAERMARLMAEAKERMQQADGADAQGSTRAHHHAGKAGQPAPEADNNVREEITLLYRHLAKLLHPDLEQDPARRAEKEAAMKDVTLAYKANDLLALLRIEVEWARGDTTRVAGMDEQRLEKCNMMLAAQVKELKQELRGLSTDPRYGPASLLGHPFFGFDGFNRSSHLDAIRTDIVRRQQWVLELQDGRNPGEILAYAMAEPSGLELLDSLLEELDEFPPPRPRRKR